MTRFLGLPAAHLTATTLIDWEDGGLVVVLVLGPRVCCTRSLPSDDTLQPESSSFVHARARAGSLVMEVSCTAYSHVQGTLLPETIGFMHAVVRPPDCRQEHT